MVNATPYDYLFNIPSIKNSLKVKAADNTMAATSTNYADATSSIANLFESLGAVELAAYSNHKQMDKGNSLVSNYVTKEVSRIGDGFVGANLLKNNPIDVAKHIAPVSVTTPDIAGIVIDENGDMIISMSKLGEDQGIEVLYLAGGLSANTQPIPAIMGPA